MKISKISQHLFNICNLMEVEFLSVLFQETHLLLGYEQDFSVVVVNALVYITRAEANPSIFQKNIFAELIFICPVQLIGILIHQLSGFGNMFPFTALMQFSFRIQTTANYVCPSISSLARNPLQK